MMREIQKVKKTRCILFFLALVELRYASGFLGCAHFKDVNFCPGLAEANKICEQFCNKSDCFKAPNTSQLQQCIESTFAPLGCSFDYLKTCPSHGWPGPTLKPFPGCDQFVPAEGCPVSPTECENACLAFTQLAKEDDRPI